MSISLNGDGIISGVSSITVGAGASVFSPAANTLALGTNDVERFRVTSTGQLQATSASDVRLTLGSSGTAGTNDSNHIRGDGTSLKFMNASGGATLFENNGTERFRITNDGVTFNGDTAAENALDDYEEGTWTPVLSYDTPGTVSVGYATQQGHYTKVGNLVHFRAEVRLNAFTKGTASGELILTGLPFTAKSVTGSHYLINLRTYAASLPATLGQYPVAQVYSTLVQFSVLVDNNASISFPDPDGNAQYKVSGTYLT